VLETLLWPDEVRPAAFAFLDQDIEIRSQELKMAASLIDSMTVDFDPEAHRDGYREALQEVVDAKTQDRDVVQPAATRSAAGEPVSLADALKASLAAVQRKRTPASTARIASAKAGAKRASAAKAIGAKAGPPKAGTPKAGTPKAGAAKPGTAKSGSPGAGQRSTRRRAS
jgi:DNA end-binding protein Ku